MFTDVMVDVETTGTSPDRTGVIQIAAVKFNIETKDVSTEFFNECLLLPPHRFWDESTRAWWMKQNPHVLRGIFEKMRDPREVMAEFCQWAAPVNSLRFWSKPLSFDYPLLQSYARDYELMWPFDFRQAVDCRSFVRGIYFPEQPFDEKNLPFEGDKHNAIFDVLHQIKWVLHCREQRP